MPLLPSEIERAILNKKPEMVGEEGVLYSIPLRNEAYFAKQWRGKHFVDATATYSVESGKTPVSPYWHKVKFYEQALIHQAFPENSVKMSAAYDPRIHKDTSSSEWKFDPDNGRPVTVIVEVRGDESLQALRDQIIKDGYKGMYATQEADKKGMMRRTKNPWIETEDQSTLEKTVSDTDDKIRKLLGKELVVPLYDPKEPKNSITLLKWLAEQKNKDSILCRFFDHGLVPVHPEFNFIPTAPSDSGGPKGVFLEVTILDPQALLNKLLDTHPSQEERNLISKKMNTYLLYRKLDEIYDQIFAKQYTAEIEDPILINPEVKNAVFQVLEYAKQHARTLPPQRISEFLDTLSLRLDESVHSHTDTSSVLEDLRKVRSFFV